MNITIGRRRRCVGGKTERRWEEETWWAAVRGWGARGMAVSPSSPISGRPPPSRMLKSRGDLPLRYLQSQKSPAEFAEEIQEEVSLYNGFNLVVANVLSKSMVYITNRPRHGDKLVTPVSPGIHVLSNANLDAPWPKCLRLREGFKQLLADNEGREFPVKTMVEEVMTDTVKDQEPELPNVFTPETEYHLSSIFVDMLRPAGRYGTRSISALSIKSHGDCCFYERHLEQGGSWKEHTQHFVIQHQSIV